jgi:uroporphyrinogen-III synthase
MSDQLHILSTRSLHSNAVEKLQHSSWKITVHDFISKKIEWQDTVAADSLNKNIVLTSRTGVEAFLDLIKKLQVSPADYHVHCIAQATKQAATQAGLVVNTSAPNALLLAEEIMKHQDIRSVTHICGNRRREELSEILNAGGVEVKDVVAYHTALTPIRVEQPYDGLLFFSPSAVDSFLSANELRQVPCFCIGQTTESHAKQKGFTQTYTPQAPSEDALVNLVIEHFTSTSVHAEE